MAKPPIFLHAPGLRLDRDLEDEFQIVTWPAAQADQQTFLAEVAPRIEAAAGFGSAPLPPAFETAAVNLKLIALLSAGYESFDPAALSARGVALTHCPNLNHIDVAEVGLGLMISVLRRIAPCDRALREGRWRYDRSAMPRRISGQKLGVVGLGAIGKALAGRAQAMGMEVAWTGPRRHEGTGYPFMERLLDLAAWSDVLAICCRADPGTAKMISAEVLDALGPDGVVINVARGSIVDEDALIEALKSGRLGGAGLDVFEREPTDPERWRDVPNTTLSPHMGGATREAVQAALELLKDNLRRFFAGRPLATPVA